MRFCGISEIFGVVGVLAQKTGALAKFGNFSGIFVDFWSVWSGSGHFCKYFLEAKGLVVSLPNAQGLQRNLQQSQEALCKIVGIY
jgi:hypothetical protein